MQLYFPKKDPVDRESPTIIVIPTMASKIEKLINEIFSLNKKTKYC